MCGVLPSFRNNHCDEKLQALLFFFCSYQFLELINYNPECLFHNIFMKTIFSLFQMISDLNTYLHKAVPDTRLTIKKYLDGKFEYLVSCFWIFVIWYRFETLSYYSKRILFISHHFIVQPLMTNCLYSRVDKKC